MDYHVLLTFGLVMSLSLICHAQSPENDTCMHQWMVHSGIPLENAVAYEVTIRSVHYDVENLNQTSSLPIGVLMMGGNVAHAKSLKGCFAGIKGNCQNYNPCGRGGSCVLTADKSTYKCRCAKGRKGHFCQHDIDYCASNPCKHGGFCTDGVTNFTCTCAAGFEGVTCEKQWFTVDHFRDMQKTVITLQGRNSEMAAQIRDMEEDKNQTAAKMKELQEQHNATVLRMQNKLEELEKQHTTLANRKQDVVGYAYKSFRVGNGDDNGQVLPSTFNFTKKENNTLLRLMYSANIRVVGGGVAYWYFQIDGSKCTQPGDIDIYLHESSASYSYSPAVLTGICSATSAGKLLAGGHVITVHVKSSSDAFTGDISQSFLQVQEIIPPY